VWQSAGSTTSGSSRALFDLTIFPLQYSEGERDGERASWQLLGHAEWIISANYRAWLTDCEDDKISRIYLFAPPVGWMSLPRFSAFASGAHSHACLLSREYLHVCLKSFLQLHIGKRFNRSCSFDSNNELDLLSTCMQICAAIID